MKYLGWPYRAYMKTAGNGGFCEKFLNENYFEVVLASFCCCDDGVNAFEAVKKMVTDQPTSCVYSLLNSQNISINSEEGRLLGHLLNITKKTAKVAQKNEQ